MKHSFLFEPGRWEAQGYSVNAENQRVNIDGFAHFTRNDYVIMNDSKMVVHGKEEMEIYHRYKFELTAKNSNSTRWTSEHSALGGLSGMLTVIDDTIFVLGATKDGKNSYCESIRCVDESTYMNRGVFVSDAMPLYSWAVELKRS
jgi:hypothetical protein